MSPAPQRIGDLAPFRGRGFRLPHALRIVLALLVGKVVDAPLGLRERIDETREKGLDVRDVSP